MSDADWIVLRFNRDVPLDEVPPELEGKWIDRSLLTGTYQATRQVQSSATVGRTRNTVARPTGRFELNDQFDVAEVWEVQNWDLAS